MRLVFHASPRLAQQLLHHALKKLYLVGLGKRSMPPGTANSCKGRRKPYDPATLHPAQLPDIRDS